MGHPGGPNPLTVTFPHATEKFGKVYLNHMSNTDDFYCLDAKFSIVDFKWYSNNGDVHPTYKLHKQKPFYYQFTMKNKDKEGREVEFTGKLRLSFPLEGMPPIHLSHLEHAESFGHAWSLSVGLVSDKDERKMRRFTNTRFGYFGTGVTPTLTVEQRKLTLMFMCTFFTFDDYLLDLGAPSFAKLLQITNRISAVVRGNTTWQDEQGEDPDGVRPFLYAVQDMRREALKYATEEEASYFFEALCEHIHSYAVETCSEYKNLQSTDVVVFRNAHPSLRCLTFAFKVVLDMILVSNGIVLDKSVRQCFLFKHFRRLCEQHTCTVNDVMSFQKEMRDKETCNYTILLHVVDGLPLEAALKRTFDEINSLTDQIVKLGEMLEKLFPDKPEVARLVDVAKQIVQGHYFYFPFASRYGHDLTYDCVVDCD